ncbi:MAG: TIGR03936 family radical SAM-associated protein [Coriobacteriia bacterium]|nr:TIGR03936 family radical SAM-associated protein [Coriobacteriia bacterium]
MEQQVFRLRALYAKQGRLVMLSHLEVAESLRRAVRRAGLPFAVSQGFSPHMKMTFSAALPVGVGSTCEIFDLYLTEYVPAERAFAALAAASVPDLMVSACAYVEPKAKAAGVAFPVGVYAAEFSGAAEGLVFPQVVTVQRAKKKPKTHVVADYLRGEAVAQGRTLTFALEALPTGSLRPDYLLAEALRAHNETADSPLALLSCTRIDQRDESGISLVASLSPLSGEI